MTTYASAAWPRTHLDVVDSIFPEVVSEDEAASILWNQTAFPCAGNDWLHYHEQLLTLKQTISAGLQPCEFCNRPGKERGKSSGHIETWVCDECWKSGLFDSWRKTKRGRIK